MRPILLALCLAFAFPSLAAEALSAEEAKAALARAIGFYRSISTRGGYLWSYSQDLSDRKGEGKAKETEIWVQPPGAPAVGIALLRAHRATGEKPYLDAAREAGQALAYGQLESGGWDYRIDFDPAGAARWYRRADVGKLDARQVARRRNNTVFDDDNTQSAVRFLLELAEATKGSADARDAEVRSALDHALTGMLMAQYPNGAWPQVWRGAAPEAAALAPQKAELPADWRQLPKVKEYWYFPTFNDHAMRQCVLTMLEAHAKTGKAEHLAAARRCGDFILAAQLPEPQPAWAQQYDFQFRPAWARKFEPPAVCSTESAGVIRTLVDLHLATGEAKYLAPIPAALRWLERSKIAPGKWSRFYELGTNRPLYLNRQYEVVYTDDDLPTHYSFQGGYGVESAARYYEEVKARGREAYLKDRAGRAAPRRAALAARAARVISELDERGRWLVDGRIDSERFIENVGTLCDYLEAR